jgi:nicotinamidase-related amidase
MPGSSFEKYMDWPKMRAGDPATNLFGELETAGYQIMEKPGYSAWTVTVQQKVEASRYEAIVLFGLDAEACVLKTALDIFEAGKRPVVLEDLCHSSNGLENNKVGIELMKTLLGVRQVTTTSGL